MIWLCKNSDNISQTLILSLLGKNINYVTAKSYLGNKTNKYWWSGC